MKRRVLALFMTICMVLSLIPNGVVIAHAEVIAGGSCGNNLEWIMDEDGVLEIMGTGQMYDYNPPEEVPSWYEQRDLIKKVYIGQGVTSIGSFAFVDCDVLTTVTYAGSAPTIADDAFSGVTATVYYPCGNDTWTEEKMNNYGGTLSWVIKHTGEVIDEDLCSTCSNFCGENLTWTLEDGTLTISGTGEMYNFSFYSATPWYSQRESITNLVLEEGITTIGDHAFEYCKNITGSLSIPDSVVEIGEFAFRGSSITGSLVVGKNVTTIGQYAFSSCRGLSDIEIPSSVTAVGESAFSCSDWNSITFAGDVPELVGDGFEYGYEESDPFFEVSATAYYPCGNATWTAEKMESYGGTITWVKQHSGEMLDDATCSECAAANIVATGTCGDDLTWTLYSDGVLEITGSGEMDDYTDDYASEFEGRPWAEYRNSIQKVIIGDGVTSVGDYAFDHLYKLKSVTIPSSLQRVGEYAFEYTRDVDQPYRITDVYITDLSAWCEIEFSGSSSKPLYGTLYLCGEPVTDLVIPEGTREVGDYFWGCKSLVSVTIPESVTSIGKSAFGHCSNLTSVTLPERLTSIGAYAFENCKSLENVEIPENVTSIGACAFSGCRGLVNVTLPNGISELGHEVFYECTSLTNVTIPEGVTSIGYRAFCDCSNMLYVTIPASVTFIGNQAFSEFIGESEVPREEVGYELHHILYTGTQSQWDSISIDSENSGLTRATRHYNCSGDEIHVVSNNCEEIVCYCSICFESFKTSKNGTHNYVDDVCTVCGEIMPLASGTCGENVTWKLYGDGVLEITGSGEMYDEDGCPFEAYSDSIKKLVVGEGVISIGGNALYQCYNLEEVILPQSLTSINSNAFSGCSNLEEVVLPQRLTCIDYNAFYGCSSLEEITIPGAVTEIGYKAFCGCEKLKKVVFEGDAPQMNEVCFYGLDATVYYPCSNETWEEAAGNDYGANWLGWEALHVVGQATTPAVAPTCTVSGLTAGGFCGACGASAGRELVPALGHAFEGGICTRCQMSFDEAEEIVNASVLVIFKDKKEQYAEIAVEAQLPVGSTYNDLYNLAVFPSDEEHTDTLGGIGCWVCNGGDEPVKDGDRLEIYAVYDYENLTYTCYALNDDGVLVSQSGTTRIPQSSTFGEFFNTLEFPDSNRTIAHYQSYIGRGDAYDHWVTAYPCYEDLTPVHVNVEYLNESLETSYMHTTIYLDRTQGLTEDTVKAQMLASIEKLEGLCPTGMEISDYTWGELHINHEITTASRYMEEVCSYCYADVAVKYETVPEVMASGSCGDDLTWTLKDGTLAISGTGAMYNFSSSSVAPWYSQRSSITNVVLEEGITTIGNFAFWRCDRLRDIEIPSSVISIGDVAFNCCYELRDIEIPSSVISIGDAAFVCCYELCDIEIPSSVISIGKGAFGCCYGMNSITFAGNAPEFYRTEAGEEDPFDGVSATAYYPCGNATWTAEKMESYGGTITWVKQHSGEMLGDATCSDCAALNIVASGKCGDNLTWTLYAGGTLTVSGTGEMAEYNSGQAPWNDYRDSMKKLVLEDGITRIGNGAFYGCNGLLSVTIPDSVTSIGYGAFMACIYLDEIVFTGDVPAIGEEAFTDVTATAYYPCGNDTWTDDKLQNYGGELNWVKQHSGEMLDDATCSDCAASNIVASGTCGDDLIWMLDANGLLMITGSGAMYDFEYEAYDTTIPWSGEYITDVVIADGVTSIGNSAFYYCEGLTSVMIPDSVTSIGDRAFYCCKGLTSVTIPDSVTSIGNYAFFFCESLTSVTIGNSVTSIGDWAFYHCSNLTSVTIPDSVTSIGDHAFDACNSLTSVTIPDSVTSIGDGAFQNCSSLTSVTIGNSVTSISDYAFAFCYGLTTVTIGNSVTSIGNDAFSGCESLTSVTIPDSVTSIGSYAFASCYGLTSVTIPDSVKSVGLESFSGCRNLTSVTIGNSVMSIGDWAFYDCSNLTSVTIPDSVTSIGKSAFHSCDSLTSVTIGNSVTSIGNSAFARCYGLYEIVFAGNAPAIGEEVFTDVTATAYYPCSNDTWTDDKLQNYGGTITWAAQHSYQNGVCSGCGDENRVKITSQPESVTVKLGEMASVSVVAEGEGLSYRWYYTANGSVFESSNTTSTYSIEMNDYRAGRQVYCVITDAYGNSVTSETVTLYMG